MNNNVWQIFFNSHAPYYLDNEFTHNTEEEVRFLIDELKLTPKSRILDVGCGTGRHALQLAKRGYLMTGLDLSESMLNEARKAALELKVPIDLIQADASDFSLNSKYDGAISICEGAFGLLSQGDQPVLQPLKILININNALKTGGKLIITVLNGCRMIRLYNDDDVSKGKFDPLNIVEHSTIEYSEGKSVQVREKGFMVTELKMLMNLAGFNVQHIYGGTAGSWNRGPLKLDEYEIMMIALKETEPQSQIINTVI
ncbi:class I SAM-dependent methyltransferase [bacterium]|nr:class I SAM-dependent methyltransferase [bacterium]